MTQQTTDLTVHKSIIVQATQQRAFDVFTTQMGSWWPLQTKTIGSAAAQTAVLEPYAGGRWFERGVDGSECDWGHVIAYEPPTRVVLNWQISAAWRHDPAVNSEVEVRFVAEDETRTRIELEHRGLRDAYGEHAEQMQAIFDSPDGWAGILADYEALAKA